MARTPLFDRMLLTLRTAASRAPAREAVEEARARALTRRGILQAGGAMALAACAAPAREDPLGSARSAASTSNANIGVVGAGIAGLACATELVRLGVPNVTIHEGGGRAGGRIFSSMGDAAWGQAFEKGGEFIDTPHKTMIGYARSLGLTLEDVNKTKNLEPRYWFGGEPIDESVMVEEYRALVDAMRDDLRALGTPTADPATQTQADRDLDRLSLAEWLTLRNAGPHIKALLEVSYTIEYGVPPADMSCLSFLFFAKASRQSKIRLFGNWSDERYHVVGGNQQIPDGLAARLGSKIAYGRRLVAARKLSDGRVQLTFKEGNKTVTATHDAVVFALPFPRLRDVQLDASLGLPSWKLLAIQQALHGDNSKLMISFAGAPWAEVGCNGSVFTNLPYLQNTWETSPSTRTASRAILTDYTGGALARSLGSAQTDAARFLGNLDTVIPGSKARARKDSRGKIIAHVENWTDNAFTKGAYTANQPGYFTTLEGLAAKPVGNLFFAGEYTDSFYDWQGFMEGGALSGLRAAAEVDDAFG